MHLARLFTFQLLLLIPLCIWLHIMGLLFPFCSTFGLIWNPCLSELKDIDTNFSEKMS